jgi:hypothetical protein
MKKKITNIKISKARRVVVKFNTGTRFHKSKQDLMDKAHKRDLKNQREE